MAFKNKPTELEPYPRRIRITDQKEDAQIQNPTRRNPANWRPTQRRPRQRVARIRNHQQEQFILICWLATFGCSFTNNWSCIFNQPKSFSSDGRLCVRPKMWWSETFEENKKESLQNSDAKRFVPMRWWAPKNKKKYNGQGVQKLVSRRGSICSRATLSSQQGM